MINVAKVLTSSMKLGGAGKNWKAVTQNVWGNSADKLKGFQKLVNKQGASRMNIVGANAHNNPVLTINGNNVYHHLGNGRSVNITYGLDKQPLSGIIRTANGSKPIPKQDLWFYSSEASEFKTRITDCLGKNYGNGSFTYKA